MAIVAMKTLFNEKQQLKELSYVEHNTDNRDAILRHQTYLLTSLLIDLKAVKSIRNLAIWDISSCRFFM